MLMETNTPPTKRPTIPSSARATANDSSEARSRFDGGRETSADIQFNFTATDSLGGEVRGTHPGPDKDTAIHELETAGLQVKRLAKGSRGSKSKGRPKSTDLATLAEQFGELMEIGESPSQVCRILAATQTNKHLSDSLKSAGEMVLNGFTLSEAFARQTYANGNPIYPATFVTALRVGEEVGTATDSSTGGKKSAFLLTLGRFAETERKAEAIRSSIKSALMYPVAVVVFCIVAVAAVLYFVMPRMVELYSALLPGDAELPWPTQVLVTTSDFLTSVVGLATMAVVLLAILGLVRWLKTPQGDEFVKTRCLRLPIFGSFFRLYFASQTLRTLAILSAGIPSMTERLKVAAETSTNPEYKRMLNHVRHRFVLQSTELSRLFAPYYFLMGDEFRGVLITYEQTADMQDSFHNYAKLMETRAERELESVLFYFQNFAIVPVGLFIGFIVLALYSPMFEIAGRVSP